MFAPNIQNVAVTTDATPEAQRQRLLAAALARKKMAEGDTTAGRGRQQQTPFAPRNGGQMAAGLGMVAMGELLNKVATDRETEKAKEGAMAQADAMVTAVQSLGGPFANINATALKGAFLTNPELASQVVKMGMENMLKPQERFETITLPDGRQAQRSTITGKIDVMPEGRGPMAVAPGSALVDPNSGKTIAAMPDRSKLLSPEEERQKIRIAQESRPQTTINNNMPGADKFAEEASKFRVKDLGTLVEAGRKSVANSGTFQSLRELNKIAPTGPIAGRLAEMFPNATTAGAAFTALVSQTAPTLRVEGSGATSDRDIDLIMKGLPRLANRPDANEAIINLMEKKNQINIKRGELAMQALQAPSEQERGVFLQQIQELDRMSILDDTTRKLLGIEVGQEAQQRPLQQPGNLQLAAPVQGPPMPQEGPMQPPMPQAAPQPAPAPQGLPPLDLIEQEILRRQQQQQMQQMQQQQMPMVP